MTLPDRVGAPFQELRRQVEQAGPIPAKLRALILIGACTATRDAEAFKQQCRFAAAEGATLKEVRQAVLLTLGASQGLSPVVEALAWADEVLADPG